MQFSGFQSFIKSAELELDLAIEDVRTSSLLDAPDSQSGGDTESMGDDSCVDAALVWSSTEVLSPNGKLVTSITKDLSRGDRSAMKCVLQEVCADETNTHTSPYHEFFQVHAVADNEDLDAEYRVGNLNDEFQKAFSQQEKVSAVRIFPSFFVIY